MNVGETVIWQSAVGPVECEYRGKTGDQACVIVREAGSAPYQTMVPVSKLSKKEPTNGEEA